MKPRARYTLPTNRDFLLDMAEIAWLSAARSPDAEWAMWVWLLRWTGAPA